MPDLSILDVTPDHAFGTLPGVMYYVWRGATTVAAAQRIADGCRQARDTANGLPVVLFGIVETGAPPPDPEIRRVLAASMKASDFLSGSALCFEGQGFQASMVRAVATGLALLARTSFPHQVFAGKQPAAEWLHHHAPRHTVAQLLDGLEQMRALKVAAPKPATP